MCCFDDCNLRFQEMDGFLLSRSVTQMTFRRLCKAVLSQLEDFGWLWCTAKANIQTFGADLSICDTDNR